ncbi:hypothetical protein B0H19DRAFT_1080070 [Mycena capillaripes]|nr:hypothetical protein B0H19DRAFT_1080070 [Mycena capillaripes]
MSPNEIVVTVRVSSKAAEPLELDEWTLIWGVMESEIARENGIAPGRGNVSLRPIYRSDKVLRRTKWSIWNIEKAADSTQIPQASSVFPEQNRWVSAQIWNVGNIGVSEDLVKWAPDWGSPSPTLLVTPRFMDPQTIPLEPICAILEQIGDTGSLEASSLDCGSSSDDAQVPTDFMTITAQKTREVSVQLLPTALIQSHEFMICSPLCKVIKVALMVLFVTLCELLRRAFDPLVPTWETVAAAASNSEDAGVSNAVVIPSAVTFDEYECPKCTFIPAPFQSDPAKN